MKAVAHLGSGFLHENVCMPYLEKSYKIIMLRRYARWSFDDFSAIRRR